MIGRWSRSSGASAQNKCTAKARWRQKFTHERRSLFAGSNGVTIWFSSTPITAEERDFLQLSSTADQFRRDAPW
jgi:hypothetical protein